jgi:aminoglycoside phosphotransferase (APT) family kinase protein
LLILQQAGLAIAPEPLLLDRERYSQPVVVQTWLEGEVSAEPPTTDADWGKLLQHMATVHRVTPAQTDIRLPPAFEHANSVAAGRKLVADQVRLIPPAARPASLQALLQQFEAVHFPAWPEAPVTLCRADSNIGNMIRRNGAWVSVDWEYSGWGDPAFEIAEMMVHPAYIGVPASRWQWLMGAYSDLVEDITAAVRIPVYYQILLVWWVARLARSLYEIPKGLDQRLAHRPSDWLADQQHKYDHYLRLSQSLDFNF